MRPAGCPVRALPARRLALSIPIVVHLPSLPAPVCARCPPPSPFSRFLQAGDVLQLGCVNTRFRVTHRCDTVWKLLYSRDCVPPAFPRLPGPESPTYHTLVRSMLEFV